MRHYASCKISLPDGEGNRLVAFLLGFPFGAFIYVFFFFFTHVFSCFSASAEAPSPDAAPAAAGTAFFSSAETSEFIQKPQSVSMRPPDWSRYGKISDSNFSFDANCNKKFRPSSVLNHAQVSTNFSKPSSYFGRVRLPQLCSCPAPPASASPGFCQSQAGAGPSGNLSSRDVDTFWGTQTRCHEENDEKHRR